MVYSGNEGHQYRRAQAAPPGNFEANLKLLSESPVSEQVPRKKYTVVSLPAAGKFIILESNVW